jgi:hypothetical protein
MTYDPMRDPDEERDAYYPFQSGYASRGSLTPYVIAVLALAILAVVGINIASIDNADLPRDRQITTESQPKQGDASTRFN